MADQLYRFLLKNLHVRGEWVKLESAWQHIVDTTAYPKAVRSLLGEATAAITLLAASLKFKGSLTLQMNNTHPVDMLVVQAKSDGSIRAIAHWDGEIEDTASYSQLLKSPRNTSSGTLVITVEHDDNAERYQSIIALEGDCLADTLANYFQQSEQLPTYFQLTSDDDKAAGLMIQSLPTTEENAAEGWEHALILAQTVSDEELLALSVEELFHLLYHNEDRYLYDGEPIHFACSCSQTKIEEMVLSLGVIEAKAVIEAQGKIDINCQFCNRHYALDSIDVTRIFDGLSDSGMGSVH